MNYGSALTTYPMFFSNAPRPGGPGPMSPSGSMVHAVCFYLLAGLLLSTSSAVARETTSRNLLDGGEHKPSGMIAGMTQFA